MPEKTSDCPRKIKKKVGEKKISAREKNQEKYQKPFSRALLIFSGKKKHYTLRVGAVWVRFGFQLGLQQTLALIIMHLDYGTI